MHFIIIFGFIEKFMYKMTSPYFYFCFIDPTIIPVWQFNFKCYLRNKILKHLGNRRMNPKLKEA